MPQTINYCKDQRRPSSRLPSGSYVEHSVFNLAELIESNFSSLVANLIFKSYNCL